MWGAIATWCMSKDGVDLAAKMLAGGSDAGDAVETAIRNVEDCPFYKSVGFGGLPNEDGEVELDAAFMDGSTFSVGAVAALRDFANPISIARRLSLRNVNSMLVGGGAAKFASMEGFERKNMLTERAKAKWNEKRSAVNAETIKPYAGHDTVGVICLDSAGKICVGTSTSGLFMKKRGRIGDSPLAGCGFYADSDVGAASATGLGEDLTRGCISYEIVRLMREMPPMQACRTAVRKLDAELKKRRGSAGDISVLAMNAKGEWGAASNIAGFSFSLHSSSGENDVWLVEGGLDEMCCVKASAEWIKAYRDARRQNFVQ